MNTLDVYRAYLQKRIEIVRGYSPRYDLGSAESLAKRGDKYLFRKLCRNLDAVGLTKQDMFAFMAINAKRLGHDFLVTTLLHPDALSCWQAFATEYGSTTAYLRTLKKQGRHIIEYIVEYNISMDDFFLSGSPPIAVRWFREGKLDEAILVYSGHVETLLANKLIALCIGKALTAKQIRLVEDRIKMNDVLRNILELIFEELREV